MTYESEFYDLTWLVVLAKDYYPDDIKLQEELKKCTTKLLVGDDESIVYFVNPDNANLENAEWQYKESIPMYVSNEGDVVIDIMQSGKVGAIELTWLIKD